MRGRVGQYTMRIIGIDPGIRCTGYGIITVGKGDPQIVDYGTIKPPVDGSIGERLAVLYDDLDHLIKEHSAEVFAIEDSFFGVNARSALVLGHARGAALLCAAHNKLPSSEYAPRKVKLAVTGNGRATKEQVQFMVQRILNMEQAPSPLDASDALAVAICHHQQMRARELMA